MPPNPNVTINFDGGFGVSSAREFWTGPTAPEEPEKTQEELDNEFFDQPRHIISKAREAKMPVFNDKLPGLMTTEVVVNHFEQESRGTGSR